ncbi:MAG: HAD family phosphatase [Firmicutes bacterium]|nr:HAD family phosphatase [Bacillota bacterium]
MKYKLIFTDMDGTLLNKEKFVSKEDMEAIKKAEKMGVQTVICSGRSHMSLQYFVNMLGFDKDEHYAIGYNGGIVYKTKNREIIIQHKMKLEYAKKILNECRKFDIDIILYNDAQIIVEKMTEEVKQYCEMSRLEPVMVGKYEDIMKCDISKILLKGSNEKLKKIYDYFLNTEYVKDVDMFFSSERLLEFNPKNVNKGSAIKELCEYLGISTDEVIGIGDSYNDIEMIEISGVGVAVQNANDDVKKKADYITKRTNNESPFSEVADKFIFG